MRQSLMSANRIPRVLWLPRVPPIGSRDPSCFPIGLRAIWEVNKLTVELYAPSAAKALSYNDVTHHAGVLNIYVVHALNGARGVTLGKYTTSNNVAIVISDLADPANLVSGTSLSHEFGHALD